MANEEFELPTRLVGPAHLLLLQDNLLLCPEISSLCVPFSYMPYEQIK